MKRFLCLLAAMALLLAACAAGSELPSDAVSGTGAFSTSGDFQSTESLAWTESNPAEPSILESGIETSEEPLPMTPEETVNAVLAGMTLEEKVYQLFVVTPDALTDGKDITAAGDATKNALERYPVAGLIYFRRNVRSKKQMTDMIANTRSYSKLPLLICVDEEGGRVSRLSRAGTPPSTIRWRYTVRRGTRTRCGTSDGRWEVNCVRSGSTWTSHPSRT